MTVALLFPPEFIQAVAGLLLLVVIDVAAGIAVALKTHTFEFSKLADFYVSGILPNVFLWAVVDILLRVGAFYHLPVIDSLQQLGTAAFYAAAVVATVAQIVSKVAVLSGSAPASKA